MMEFDFATAGRIIFQNGAINEIGKIAIKFGTVAFLVSGSGKQNRQKVEELFALEGIKVIHFSVSGEPSVDHVIAAIKVLKQADCGLVVGIGGGSVIDTAKAVAALATNPGDLLDYLEVVGKGKPLVNKPLPFIAIPTTSGTGSEVTRNAVLSVPERQVKVSLRSKDMLADVAIIDPMLTVSTPPDVTAATGMDALCQVLEPMVSSRANVLVDAYCRAGLERAGWALLRCYRNPDDMEARTAMSFVSLMGGLALANAGLGAVHGFAGPLGGMYAAPHGALCARLLPAVVRVNLAALKQRDVNHSAVGRYDLCTRLLLQNDRVDASILPGWLDDLCTAMQIPRLGSFGLQRQDFAAIIPKARMASSMKGNPIVLSDEELEQILSDSL